MSELSNAVTVLIARMESHPEDFEASRGQMYSSSKFGDMAHSITLLTERDPQVRTAFWYLSDADKEALIAAWKKFNYTKLEKEVMEKIFDDGEGERERVKQQQQRAHINAQMARIGAAQQLQPGQIHPGQIHAAPGMAIQGGNYNGGLFGQAGSAIQGLFK